MEKNEKIYFIMQYMEPDLSEWSVAEIEQIIKYLSRLEHNIFIITNF